jgi:hypothetical protein
MGWRQGTEVKVVDAASGIARTRTAGCHTPPAGNEVRRGKAAKTLKELYLCAVSTLLRFRLWQRTLGQQMTTTYDKLEPGRGTLRNRRGLRVREKEKEEPDIRAS